MNIHCTITDDEFSEVEPHIDCGFSNPMQDEFIFYDPTDLFILKLMLMGIEVSKQQ